MTTAPDIGGIAADLTARFGLSVSASYGRSPEGSYCDIRPTDLRVNEGLFVRATLGWRHVLAELRFESFAADVVAMIAHADNDQRAQFCSIAKLLLERSGRVILSAAGRSINPVNHSDWPVRLESLSLSVERTPVMVDHDDPAALRDLVGFWGGNLLGMAVSLLPLEPEEPAEFSEVQGLPEGARERIEVNRYERSRINRMLCIELHGTACRVCGFQFEEVYGTTGRGFVHVHHVVPVSRIGADYVINPRVDLVPVCANCHAMLHRRDPPFSVEELRSLMPLRRAPHSV